MTGASRAAGILFAWATIMFALCAAVCGIAGDGKLLASEMLHYAPPEDTRLPETEYEAVGRMTAGYLTGGETVFQHTFSNAAGETFLCFQEHEAAHMADCRELIRLAGTVWRIAGAAAPALAGAGVFARNRRKTFGKGMLTGLRIAGGIAAAVLVWALTDFDGLFTVFHRLAFTNEGWLLDPRTDLLIRLMPTAFFEALGIRVLAAGAGAGLAADAAARIMIGRQPKMKSER